MSHNVGSPIHNCADMLMEIIERESAKRAEWWKREYESLRRKFQQLVQDREVAQREAQKAREESESYKAEIERYKHAVGCVAEIGQLRTEVQEWKNKYDMAVRLQNELQQQLDKTKACFSQTIIPIVEFDSNSLEHYSSASVSPMKLGASSMAETTSRSESQRRPRQFSNAIPKSQNSKLLNPYNPDTMTNNGRKYGTSIIFPTPALAAAEESLPPIPPTLPNVEAAQSSSSSAELLSNSSPDVTESTRTMFSTSTKRFHHATVETNPVLELESRTADIDFPVKTVLL